MKFTGLILICASSCLGLILPAIGVVQFPKKTQPQPSAVQIASFPTSNIPTSTPGLAANGPGSPQSPLPNSPQSPFPNSPQWTPASPQRDFLPDSLNAAPSPFPSPTPQQLAPQVPVAEPNLSEASASSGQKFGMGVWLLLVPVCFIGLAMWTFSPNPSGAKRPS